MRKFQLSLSLDRHFAAIGAAAAAVTGLGVAQQADAGLVYSGVVNLNIPVTTAGIYLNVVTGVAATTPAGSPGWDLNPWGTSSLFHYANNAASPNDGVITGFAGGTSATLVDNLPTGTPIDGSATYSRISNSETTGPTVFNFNSSNNLIGFRFQNEGTGQLNYGWARYSLSGALNAAPRAVVEYAYDDTGAGVQAGIVPEPTGLALLAAGALGLVARRRTA